MLPTSRNYFPTFSRFFDEDWSNLFDWNGRNNSNTKTTIPSVNVKETKDNFIIEVAAPGMKKDDFYVELHDNMLTIKSERRRGQEEKDKNDRYTRQEFSYQSFQRSFNLNNRVVDDANINAKYENGILTLHLPKHEEVKEKPARQIEIS